VLRAAGATDKGPFRPTNQDRFVVSDDHSIILIADGVGGQNAGDVAASLAVEAVLEFLVHPERFGWIFGFDPRLSRTGNLIRSAIQFAHMRVIDAGCHSAEHGGMATTMVAAIMKEATLSVGCVGDSRLYVRSSGRLRALTVDDTDRSVLTHAIGAQVRPSVQVVDAMLADGDVVLLTTDGVHASVGDARLEQLIVAAGTPDAAARAIVRAAIQSGSRDNCTAVVGKYESDSRESRVESLESIVESLSRESWAGVAGRSRLIH